MSRKTGGSDKVAELQRFLNRDVTEDRDLLKKRYLWLTPAVLKHSKDTTDLLGHELALTYQLLLNNQEKDYILFEVFIASYSIAMSSADRIVQNKTRLTENACRHISEAPLGITLQFCEETFKDVGLDFEHMFDVYAGYQFLHPIRSKDHQVSMESSDAVDDLQNCMKRFFGISLVSGSVVEHFADRVITRIPRLPKDVVSTFAERNLLVPSRLIAIDGFHLEQKIVDRTIVHFLQNT
jgi:hypothetical protein